MVQVTMLNFMAGTDFIESLNTQKSWGITVLDLKNEIFGKSLIDLTVAEAKEAAKAIEDREMSVYCFSTELFQDDIEIGEKAFRAKSVDKIEQLLETASILKPTVIRLLAARSSKRSLFSDCTAYVKEHHPWLIPLYREAIDWISGHGYEVTIENECNQCIFSNPEEMISFFDELNRKDSVYLTYDVQNLWEMGTYPSLQVYEALAPYIGFYHVKGGQQGENDNSLAWSSSLEDATWPVIPMTQQAVTDGVSPIICINPSHGVRKPGYNYDEVAKRDLDYLRKHIKGVC
ncbi:sugar phosphate isomerase/epimerase family protein [Paenibacillus roseipurpureus]|uniref:TIM barrel protein n=1 Tax=Paenibacillus roseopurpureus TaxID=2918901 RepID=A0AA96LU21_9BACL|nr:TIM barrel protein [Paenibacillus sp. MBLB1832]WNR46048.1 TIM barrel protein [Paenibacillus sp. MBLB1832]